jgi:hypothetical protein
MFVKRLLRQGTPVMLVPSAASLSAPAERM